jgi:site-specific DNA-cytosine methylase
MELQHKKILVACEYSGIVRDAFRAKGHHAWSCDIIECESDPTFHIQCDVLDILYQDWDIMIAHPPCTHLAVSGARWFTEGKKPWSLQEEALDFVRKLMAAPIHRICIENPVSVISTKIRKPDQIVHPYMFGHPEQKTTCLWLKNLPSLKETNNVKEEMMKLSRKERERIHLIAPSKDRWKERSRTFTGIAQAMAEQWSFLLP